MPQLPLPGRAEHTDYLNQDTIFAPLTPRGGSIRVYRLSGAHSREITRKLISRLAFDKLIQTNRVLAGMSFNGKPIDQTVIAGFLAPHSFTGEDVFEFSLHGGEWIAIQFEEALQKLGARMAMRGEFSFRAVQSGKMSIGQAQAIPRLFEARNDRAHQMALRQLSGHQAKNFEKVATDLRELLKKAELGIDFSDQEVDELAIEHLQSELSQSILVLEKLLQSYHQGRRLFDGIRLTLVGLPNAGKSSLFNCLCGSDRSIVTEIPGTTRDVVSERLTLTNDRTNISFLISDTAGIRATQDPIERKGVDRSLGSIGETDLVLLIIDPHTEGWLEHLNQMLDERIKSFDRNQIFGVFTKTDLSSEWPGITEQGQKKLADHWQIMSLATSSKTGQGIPELIDHLLKMGDQLTHLDSDEGFLTHEEQKQAVVAAIDQLQVTKKQNDHGLFAADLRHVLSVLAPIIGGTLTEDILGQIFSEFCIGK